MDWTRSGTALSRPAASGRVRRLAARLALLGLLASCAPTVDPGFTGLAPDARPGDFTCCADPERMPEAIAEAAIALSPVISPLISQQPIRPGYIAAAPAASSWVLGQARPLDILLTSGKNWIPGRMLRGRFTHAVVYLGTEAQLRAAGLWDAAEVVAHHDEIRAGKIFIEGVSGGARLNDAPGVFNADSALLLRPALAGGPARREAARRLLARLGMPFDFAFDVSTCDRLACTEMLAQAMPQLGFVLRPVYGTPMLMPDDVAAQAIRGENLSVIAYARGQAGSWCQGSVRMLMEDIAASWGPVPADLPPAMTLRTSDTGLGGVCTPAPGS